MKKLLNKLNNTKIIAFFSIIIIVFIIIGYLSIKNNEKNIVAEAIDAVPVNASFIVEIDNFLQFSNDFYEKNEIWSSLLNFKQLFDLKSQIILIDTFLNNSKNLKKLLSNNKLLISGHNIGNNEIFFLFSIKIEKDKLQKNITNELMNLYKIDNINSITKTYNDVKIFELKSFKNTFYFAIVDNILIFSKSNVIIENAIRQKLSNDPISIDLNFKKTSTLLSNNKTHLYFNYQQFSDFANHFFTNNFSKKIKNLKNFATFGAYDVSFNENTINLNGYTNTPDNPEFYLNLFNNIEPQTINITNILPAKTAEFIFVSTYDFSNFYTNYDKYLNAKNISNSYKNQIKTFNDDFNTDLVSNSLKLIGKSVCFIKVNFNNSDKNSAFTIIELQNLPNFSSYLTSLTEYYKKQNNITEDYFIDYEVDNSSSFTIFKFPSSELINILFGEITSTKSQQYYCYYNNFVIFGETANELKLFLNSIYRKNTLEFDEKFKNFQKDFPSKVNLLYYTNLSFNQNSLLNSISNKYLDLYKNNQTFFSKLQHIGIAFISNKDFLTNTYISARYNKELSYKGLSSWETELNNNITTKPYFFTNHTTYDKEIFVQDKNNIIYLIDKNGQVIWKKQITEQIVGNIYTVDLFNNTKYQLLFATTSYVFAIDRNGNMVENFPIKLKSTTNIGVSIADYSNKNDYRFFVPCTDKTVYLYDKTCKNVEGWLNPITNSTIVSDIYYFTNQDKDYIAFADKSKPYILDRKGNIRINIETSSSMPNRTFIFYQPQVQNQQAAFVTTDASGKIYYIYLNGKTELKSILNLSQNHIFTAYDLNQDQILDYVFTDDKTLYVYKSDGSKIFSYTFKGNIEFKPIILKFSETDIKIGVTVPSENEIYIFNSDGSMVENFPLQGNSAFSVGTINSKQNFSLIIGNNNFLCNYFIF